MPGGRTRAGKRRSKRLLNPSQKYDIWLRLLRLEVRIAVPAFAQEVDRSALATKNGPMDRAAEAGKKGWTMRRACGVRKVCSTVLLAHVQILV